jgi:molybdopterin/thiamine biosynthesis adenylyltransferase/proteasome lid subunit RPN8/RPN11
MMIYSLTIQERHAQHLQEFLLPKSGHEQAAYLICSESKIQSDPWTGQPHRKFISYEVIPIQPAEILSSSPEHISWRTQSFVNVLKRAQSKGMTVALAHSHPGGLNAFSDQDDTNESDLVQLAQNRNGDATPLLSLLVTPDQSITGRVWLQPEEWKPLELIRVMGNRIHLHYPNRGQGQASRVFQRQALAFGDALNQDISRLRIGIVGGGGTGSAVAMFLPRLGAQKIALFDKDYVDFTNLNRLHGATLADAEAKQPKVQVIQRSLQQLGLGVEVQTYQEWVGHPDCQEALKSCDLIFGCTDDHAGRLFLNRFAYYYAIPVIDLGLAIEVSQSESPEIQVLDGRVTLLQPNSRCLLCRGVINLTLARDQALKQQNPEEYERRKAEAYIMGEGNPSPSVVLFTTDTASMGLQEFLQRLQGFRGGDGSTDHRVRKFKLMDDRRPGCTPNQNCPVCGVNEHWGQGDIEPFLGLVI